METIFAKQLNQEVLDALNKLDKTKGQIVLINTDGEKFVILKEEDFQGWRETAYLLSSSKNAKVLKEALEEPLEECKNLEDILDELDS